MSFISDFVLRAYFMDQRDMESINRKISRYERSVYFFIGVAVASLFLALLLIFLLPPYPQARAHDHARPDLDKWYQTLQSRNGPCCDGPKTDALHLNDVSWEVQAKDGSHYRVRIPKNGQDFQRAVHGATVDTEWVDVPDEAVLHEPNLAGETTVWPMYGYMGNIIRCFLPGTLS